MTSVKELGETLRKRQLAVEGVDATEDDMTGAVGSSHAILLVVGGCLTLAFGALLASVTVVAPNLVWAAESLDRMGITSGAVLAAGVSLLGLGLVAKSLGQVQRGLLHAVRRSAVAGGQAESLEEIRESLGKVHFDLRVLHESTRSLLEEAHEQPLKRDSTEHGDAVFRLAASLDQLGVRLEDRLDSQQSGIERRLGSLDGAIEETRRRLTEWLDSDRDTTNAAEQADAPRERQGKRRGRGHEIERADARGNRSAGAAGDSKRERAGDEFQRRRAQTNGGEELDLPVTLDGSDSERENREDSRRRRAPRNRTSLGVLDVLDDFGQGLAQEHDEVPVSSAFLFDAQLAARLEKLAELGEEEQGADDTQQKLAQLQSLLSDSKLRRVLDSLQS